MRKFVTVTGNVYYEVLFTINLKIGNKSTEQKKGILRGTMVMRLSK